MKKVLISVALLMTGWMAANAVAYVWANRVSAAEQE